MPRLRGNLHTHSTLSDGALDPVEIARRYKAKGYDFIAFTDHRCFLGDGGSQAYWARLPPSEDGFLILRGVEEEPESLGGRHMGVIQGDTEDLRIINHPNEYGLTVDEAREAVRLANAHAIEITCHGRYLQRYDTEAIKVPKIATDDAHHALEVGVAWIEVEANLEPDSIVRAIKAGRFKNFVGGHQLQ